MRDSRCKRTLPLDRTYWGLIDAQGRLCSYLDGTPAIRPTRAFAKNLAQDHEGDEVVKIRVRVEVVE